MKKLLLIITILFGYINGVAQPAAVNNAAVLDENAGYPGYNYAVIYHAPSGKVYSKTYDGEVYVHGNNYTIALEKISRLPGNGGFFLEMPGSGTWYCDSRYMGLIRDDSVVQVIQHPEWTDFVYAENNICYIYTRNGVTVPGCFNGREFKEPGSAGSLRLTGQSYFLVNTDKSQLTLANNHGDTSDIYRFLTSGPSLQLMRSYITGPALITRYTDELNFSARLSGREKKYITVSNGIVSASLHLNKYDEVLTEMNFITRPYSLLRNPNGYSQIINTNAGAEKKGPPQIITKEVINLAFVEKNYGSFYLSTGNKPLRVFTTLKKYPELFTTGHTSSVFAVRQDDKGNIWAGTYSKGISLIRPDGTVKKTDSSHKITNGGCWYNGNMYLMTEDIPAGILRINEKGQSQQLATGINGFYSLISKDKKYFYYATGNNNGLWRCSTTGLAKGNPVWEKTGRNKEVPFLNILTISEDTAGRIWFGHSKRGLGIYYPADDSTQYWQISRHEISFGPFSSVVDHRGTVWIAAYDKGLWYYDDYTKVPSPASLRRADHPFLGAGKPITALAVYKHWLVISNYDKMLLLNLDSFYMLHKPVIRYLNPQEAGFTSFTEQNTLLTSASDSSVWFSTSDMLYQWNLDQWLQLPAYKVSVQTCAISGSRRTVFLPGQTIYFNPGTSSFDIQVRILSPDNMPRYMSGIVIRENDNRQLPVPSLQSEFMVRNTGSGHYLFLLDVYEADGSTSHYIYRFVIRKYFWQQWWPWALMGITATGLLLYLFNLKRKRELAEQKAKTKEAELQSYKNEQQKKLARLQLVSLSSQFRPHFILNALNTIGAQMEYKPEAESVLSRLGESVNIIFNHAREQKILHSFADEWKLVVNIIHIHQLMYLKNLDCTLPGEKEVLSASAVLLPMGLLQIPVENALLHGLSNREKGPWQLAVTIAAENGFLIISITDNGVGRKRSATLSNFTRHGTGIRNLTDIIKTINQANTNHITINYTDDIFRDASGSFGTTVIISIPMNLVYED